MHERPVNDQRYSIQVGLRKLQVNGRSRAEAIQRAKEQLCSDMPRMWDVIHSLEMQRFDVREIESPKESP